MKILVTGAAGFIGFYVCESLLERGHKVVGLDNINDYYDPNLKFARLQELGITREAATIFNSPYTSNSNPDFTFIRINLEDEQELRNLFQKEGFDVVCHLAAQAGVRYSLENPRAYIDSNIVDSLISWRTAGILTLNILFMPVVQVFMGLMRKSLSKLRIL